MNLAARALRPLERMISCLGCPETVKTINSPKLSGPCYKPYPTYSLHWSSFLGLPYRILIMYLVKPKKGTTMETLGKYR